MSNEAINATHDMVRDSGKPSGSNAMSREEIRARASGGKSTSERAQMIQEALREESPAEPEPVEEPSRSAEPEEAPEEAASPEPDSDAADIETWEEFLERLELSEDDLADLTRTIKVNGEQKQVTLKEAFANTQFAQANHEKAQKLAAEQRRFEAQKNEQLQKYQQTVQQAKHAHMAAARVLQEELMSPQVQMLKEHDPAQFVRWQDITQQRLQSLQSSFQQIVAEEQQTLRAHYQQTREAAQARLRNEIHDFDTPERQQKMASVFTEFGGTEAELEHADDRILLLVSKYADAVERLRKYEQAEKETKRKAKRLVEDSKSARAKAPRARGAASKKRIDEAVAGIKGKKGHSARKATQKAIFTALQEGRRGR